MSYIYRDEIILPNAEYLNSLEIPTRFAELFRLTLEKIPLWLDSGELIAGRYQTDSKTYEYDIRGLNYKYFTPEEERKAVLDIREAHGLSNIFGKGHTCIDYGRVLTEGLEGYLARIDERMTRSATEDQRTYLEAMKAMLGHAAILCARYADMADDLIKTETDIAKKAHLTRMSEALRRVPIKPARDFFEAIQSVWIMHTLIPIAENCWASISLGRFDQYMYPFYKAASDEEKARVPDYIAALFKLLDSHGDGACALNLGGLDENGCDMSNELTKVIIETEKKCRYRSPIIAARISHKTPDDIMEAYVDEKLFTVGQPTFYSDTACKKAMMARGLDEKTAANFSCNSCMGIVIAGCEVADMWGVIMNSHLPLELAVNGGKPLHGDLGFEIATKYEKPADFDGLMALYAAYFADILKFCVKYNQISTEQKAYNDPDPFISALTEDCIENACDRALGCRYRTVTIETMALTNTSDALAAIKKLVFEEKKYTIEQIVEAARENFEGFDGIRAAILGCPKYGTADSYADSIAEKLFDIAYSTAIAHNNGNTYYCPSLHTLTSNISFGAKLGATLDGRLAGEPVNKNAGPSNSVRTNDATALILSAGNLPQHLFSGGQPIDVSFPISAVRENKSKLIALIRTYASLNGLQLQVNAPDVKVLQAAHENPENYRDLIVRIGGYSAYFTHLSHAERVEFIDRFKRETT